VSEATAPSQNARPKPRFKLVRYGVYPALLLPSLLIKEHPLYQARVIQVAHAHAQQPYGKVSGRKPLT